MKNKLVAIFLCIIALIGIMYAEYRYIMIHQCLYSGEDGTVYIEIFGQVDEYYAEPIEELR